MIQAHDLPDAILIHFGDPPAFHARDQRNATFIVRAVWGVAMSLCPVKQGVSSSKARNPNGTEAESAVVACAKPAQSPTPMSVSERLGRSGSQHPRPGF